MTGYDTTSAPCWECSLLYSVKKTKVFQEILDSINNARANPSKIGETSMKALKLMCGVQIMLQ